MPHDLHRASRARLLLRASLVAALLGSAGTQAATGSEGSAFVPAFRAIESLQLHYGSNEIPAFLPDGRSATILMVHRENGNAHGYNIFVVYAAEAKDGGTGAGVSRPVVPGVPELIDLQTAAGTLSDVIRDEPFDGEAEIGAVRFVRTRVDGHAAMSLVQARRQVAGARHLTDPTPVELTVWQLDGPAALAGRTPYVFRPVSTTVTARRYCNATSALHGELGIAYPDGWDATPSIDGCPDRQDADRDAAAVQMLQRLDATSFDNSTGPRRRPGLHSFADYGFTQVASFPDGWSTASEADHSWTVGVLVLENGERRKLLCVTDSATSGTYRSTAVVEAVAGADGTWHATGRTIVRPDCAAR